METKLDIPTLEYVKQLFDLHSDHSSKCNGYRSLCDVIEKETQKQMKHVEYSELDELNNIIPCPVPKVCDCPRRYTSCSIMCDGKCK